MRPAPILALLVCAAAAYAQNDLWSNVKPEFDPPGLTQATVSTARRLDIENLIRKNVSSMGWECKGDDLDELLRGFTYENFPVAEGREILLVEAGAGCARGGQGSNGAMWMVRFDANTPVLIAAPNDGFNGWLFSIQPASSNGYHDLILGWHMGADQGGLNYFRFDGKSYQGVGSATYTVDDNDHWHIVPNPH